MSTSTTCANCGKGGESSIKLKSCAACMLVKYCSRECQIAHRPQHKKECKKRAKELHDELLFKRPPQLEEDCPICFLRMPSFTLAKSYYSCCGKVICSGCICAVKARNGGHYGLCPFCRTPVPSSDEEMLERNKKRMELNDATAFYNIGSFYTDGLYGLSQDHAKALEHYHRAAELGHVGSYENIGSAHYFGSGVEVDMKKARYYFELAAMNGEPDARYNLGVLEKEEGELDRALKHWLIAIEGGNKTALDAIKKFYLNGYATKDDYTKALKLYQAYLDDIKSKHRDKAAADDAFKYY